MPQILTITYHDYDAEPSTVSFPYGVAMTAANFDAQVVLQVALADAIAGITRGTKVRTVYGNVIPTMAVSTDPLAQRENKWLVRYHDVTTGAGHTYELPCADLTFLDPNARGQAEMGDAAEVDAFVTAFEDYVLSPDGNAVLVDQIVFVGRNI